MKFDQVTKKEISQSGDIKNNSVSIDTANLDFIVTILSTNLYSKPIQSFIRETISNAWDSHKEADNDNPVVLKLGADTEGNYYCSVQDFGVGLSPDRFDKIYRNIGSSTKRDSNQQIGGFGIGRFSALAYANVVHITSIYDGVKYNYMMYKDGNSVSIDLLHESEIDEPNGVEVKVEVKDGDLYSFKRAIESQLLYFENLYVIDETDLNLDKDFNEAYLKDYKNFKVSTLKQTGSSILLGKVCYPLRVDALNKMYSTKASNYPIAIKFDIGEIEVTPNREEVLYSADTIKLIEERLDSALEEIDELISNAGNKDFTNFKDYHQALKQRNVLYLIDKDNKNVAISIPMKDTNLTFKGKKYDGNNLQNHYDYLHRGATILISNYQFKDGRISYQTRSFNLSQVKTYFSKIYFCDVADLKKMSKDYIRDTFEDGSYFVKPLSKKELLKQVVKELYPQSVFRNYVYNSDIVRLLLQHFGKNFNRVQRFDDNKVPQTWINALKEERKKKRLEKRKNGYDPKASITLYRVRQSNVGYSKVTSDSNTCLLKDLESKFKGVNVYAEKDHPFVKSLYFMLGNHSRFRIFEVAETKTKHLLNIPNFVYIDDFTMDTNYKHIRNLATVSYLHKKIPNFHDLARVGNLEVVSEKLKDTVAEISSFLTEWEPRNYHRMLGTFGKDKELMEDIYLVAEENGYFNLKIKALIDDNEKMLKNATILDKFTESTFNKIPDDSVNLAVDYILARKLFRPSVKAVLKLKEETIFNIKKEETNEDN